MTASPGIGLQTLSFRYVEKIVGIENRGDGLLPRRMIERGFLLLLDVDLEVALVKLGRGYSCFPSGRTEAVGKSE